MVRSPISTEDSIDRRQFVRGSLSAIAANSLLAGLYTWRVEPAWVQFVERSLPVAGLPADLAGRTLVQLSDLHVGSVDQAYLVDTMQRTAALRPDFLVITGDFITAGAANAFEGLRDLLPHVPLGRLGSAAILGNHDYGPRWQRRGQADEVASIVSERGIPMLRNEAVTLGGLQFVGLDDLWSGQFEPGKAFAEADPDVATIALSHNPDTVDRPGWDAHSGWILCGHTHGGQCRPPFLPPPILPVRNRRYSAGEFALSGGRRMYINRGVGYILRVRFNVRPEVTVFHLERV